MGINKRIAVLKTRLPHMLSTPGWHSTDKGNLVMRFRDYLFVAKKWSGGYRISCTDKDIGDWTTLGIVGDLDDARQLIIKWAVGNAWKLLKPYDYEDS